MYIEPKDPLFSAVTRSAEFTRDWIGGSFITFVPHSSFKQLKHKPSARSVRDWTKAGLARTTVGSQQRFPDPT